LLVSQGQIFFKIFFGKWSFKVLATGKACPPGHKNMFSAVPNGSPTDGKKCFPNGRESSPIGSEATPVGKKGFPDGREASPFGSEASPVGKRGFPDGREASPIECEASPGGRAAFSFGSLGGNVGGIKKRFIAEALPFILIQFK
jgi:hypothetical protein